jgi:hypothetical protein
VRVGGKVGIGHQPDDWHSWIEAERAKAAASAPPRKT